MTEGFVENGFIIDLENAKGASGIIYELSSILEMPEARYRQICLKLGEIDLTQSQLLSIKSLIASLNSELALVDTNSNQTELAALSLGLIVSKLSNEIEVIEDEQTPDYLFEDNSRKQSSETCYEKLELENFEEKIEVIEKTNEEFQAEEKLKELIDEENGQADENTKADQEICKMPTLYLQQTLRSGQTISYDGNIVLIGDVHPGSEIIAKGDITVWGILGGIAHAGARGNDWAKIRALKINAIQLRISGYYARRPDSLNIPFIQKTNQFTPEEARVNNGEIALYKAYEI